MRAMKKFTAPPHPIVAARKRINQDPAKGLAMFHHLKKVMEPVGLVPTPIEVADALYWCTVHGWTVEQYANR